MKERIQKVVAAQGVYSRRQVEKLIEDRKIKVNGIIVSQKGIKVDPSVDRIQIDGKAFEYEGKPEFAAILINKPRRVLVTRSDPENRKTVYDLLPKKWQLLKPVGRLDYNSQGALIMTNDGDLILKLTHPRYHLEKVYEVKVTSVPDEKQLKRLRQGIVIDGERTLPAKVTVMKKYESSVILKFVLFEGKNRQIRKMCEAVGLTVKELRRMSIGPVKLKMLRSGSYRALTPKELNQLRRGKGDG